MALPELSHRRWLAQAAGLLVFHLVWLGAGHEHGLWLPGLGLALALVSWFGWWYALLLGIDLFVVRLGTHPEHPYWLMALDSALLAGQVALSWWWYTVAARGSRWLDDPRSATVFLLMVPGGVTAAAACLQALVWTAADVSPGLTRWPLAGALGLSRALGLLTVAPALLVLVTPLLNRARIIRVTPERSPLRYRTLESLPTGERLELTGLSLGNAILTLALVFLQIEQGVPGWALWGISLLFVVWSSLRHGLHGGIITATVGALVAFITATRLGAGPADLSPLQGNLLGQLSTALLVGASSSWIQASEARYRRVVGHIPVILYSVRLPRTVPVVAAGDKKSDSKLEVTTGSKLIEQAEVTLVSDASRQLFRTEPEALEGPFALWFERVHPEDREVVMAALAQLVLQKQPVTCEYRVAPPAADPAVANGPLQPVAWVRDTLAPHHALSGELDGWEGVVEDITEARALAQDVRRTTGMMQALVANLPTGVFFVQGPHGQPILVNARARQLLGQREDLAAGVAHLSKVYRLHRPDGSEYPAEDLPVTKALNWGMTCMANDIVVHRRDGRRVPLVTWAAPVDLGNVGQPEAAVWVLEDLTSLKRAELARSESEARLRATVEVMAEGLLIQDHQGAILECNPAAAAILGAAADQLVGRAWLGQGRECLRGDGSPMPATEHPDQLALQTGKAVRNCVVGLSNDSAVRWLQVSSVPLAPTTGAAATGSAATGAGSANRVRLVTTFTDITVHRQAQDDLQKSQRLDLMGRLAGGTIHEFNNLLTALMGMAAIARSGIPPDHPVREDIDRIIDIGEQAANVAGQLLAFGKQQRTPPQTVDVNTVIVHTLTILKSVMPASIRVETRLTPGDLWVMADDTQLKQIVMNLCLNARDAMPQGGRLCVRSIRRELEGQPWVGWSVEDDGCGIDDTVRPRIFEPFFSTKENGTGLGLAVVLQIIERFGGKIEVWTEPGKGTRFEVVLPECPPPHDWSV